jgi:hypothetical protein
MEKFSITLDWRDTLSTLLAQFEARAVRSAGLNHLFVEVADDERAKMSGPSWFAPFSRNVKVADGKPKYEKWDTSASKGLPGISPSFREAKSEMRNGNEKWGHPELLGEMGPS